MVSKKRPPIYSQSRPTLKKVAFACPLALSLSFIFLSFISLSGATKLPAIATFPNGLPEDLEAIAILPAVSDGSVDSDHSGRLDTPSFNHPHLQY